MNIDSSDIPYITLMIILGTNLLNLLALKIFRAKSYAVRVFYTIEAFLLGALIISAVLFGI